MQIRINIPRRIARWLYASLIGAIPFIASGIVHLSDGYSIRHAVTKPPELSIFAIVMSAAVMADILSISFLNGWTRFNLAMALVIYICIVYAAYMYAAYIHEKLTGLVMHQNIPQSSLQIAVGSVINCFFIELWIAKQEGEI